MGGVNTLADASRADGAPARAVSRALQLLVAVGEADAGPTLSELARANGLSPSTASRLLRTLATAGFVSRGPDRRYRPGTRLLRLAALTLGRQRIYDVAGPHLVELAATTRETANLGIRIDRDRALYLRQVASPRLVRTAVWTGRTIPLHGTAMGAALCGELGPEGYAFTRETIEPDVTAIAAPVRGPGGRILGALSITAPTYRVSDDDVAAIGRSLVHHAAGVSLALQASPDDIPPSLRHEAP